MLSGTRVASSARCKATLRRLSAFFVLGRISQCLLLEMRWATSLWALGLLRIYISLTFLFLFPIPYLHLLFAYQKHNHSLQVWSHYSCNDKYFCFDLCIPMLYAPRFHLKHEWKTPIKNPAEDSGDLHFQTICKLFCYFTSSLTPSNIFHSSWYMWLLRRIDRLALL